MILPTYFIQRSDFMALINCPECSKEISDQAVSCPHCGYSLKPVASPHKRSSILPIFLMICCIIGGIICYNKANELTPDISRTEAAVIASNYGGNYSQAKEWSEELDDMKGQKKVFTIITGACGLGACICAIIVIDNTRRNKNFNMG